MKRNSITYLFIVVLIVSTTINLFAQSKKTSVKFNRIYFEIIDTSSFNLLSLQGYQSLLDSLSAIKGYNHNTTLVAKHNIAKAIVLLKENKFDVAKQLFDSSFNKIKNGAIESTDISSLFIFGNYCEKNKNSKDALDYFEQMNFLNDSLNSIEYGKRSKELDTKYNQELKQNEIAVLTKQFEKKNIQKYFIYSLTAALLLVVLFTVYYFIDNRKKAHKLIRINKEIERQQIELEEKTNQIHDSLDYAKNIQQFLVCNETKFEENIPNSFMIFKPKDVVSGDFIFIKNINEFEHIVCLIDCTGHGISGSFISLFANQVINEFLSNHPKFKPSQIITELHKVFSETLTSSKSEVKDSLEIVCTVLNTKQNILTYSGTGNVMFKLNNANLEEFKFEYFPLGDDKKADLTQLKDSTLQLANGNQILMFSDGYADQRGGEKNKKFYYPPLRALLLEISNKSLSEQKNILSSTIENHKGQNEQTDDITVISFKID